MRPPPSYLSKLGLGGGVGGGGSAGGCVGGYWRFIGGGLQGGGACARPTTSTCIPPGGMCVLGFGGMEVCM